MFPGSLLGLVHVLPACSKGQTHQDGFYSSMRSVEPELGAAVMNEVELYVSSTTELLPVLLVLGEWEVLSYVLADDR